MGRARVTQYNRTKRQNARSIRACGLTRARSIVIPEVRNELSGISE
ncbi:hypothetical protein [Vibrio gallaecicus]|nr:hypothetical protein [Vibrio gallaecicus]MDN3616753.1 hypothetical protein [Vibrio gallaecicus]